MARLPATRPVGDTSGDPWRVPKCPWGTGGYDRETSRLEDGHAAC